MLMHCVLAFVTRCSTVAEQANREQGEGCWYRHILVDSLDIAVVFTPASGG